MGLFSRGYGKYWNVSSESGETLVFPLARLPVTCNTLLNYNVASLDPRPHFPLHFSMKLKAAPVKEATM